MFWFFALLINLNGLLINLNQTSKEFQDCFYTGCPTILFPHLLLAIAKLAQKTNNLDILKNLEKMKTGAKKFKVAPVILKSTFCNDRKKINLTRVLYKILAKYKVKTV